MDRKGSFRRRMRGTAAAFGLAASLLVSGAAVTSAQTTNPEDVLSHFLCYVGDLGQHPGAPVTLDSQFADRDVRVGGAKLFCNPVRKTRGEVVTKIVDIRQHLKAYVVRPTEPVLGTAIVTDSNQFGNDQHLTVELAPSRLLVPTRKRPHEFPVGLDHFECRRVLEGKAIERPVRLRDQFTAFRTKVLKPLLHCSPAAKLHGDRIFDIKNPEAFLVCYSIERRSLVPPQTRGTRNQFEKGPITVRVAVQLCVPSRSRLVDPV